VAPLNSAKWWMELGEPNIDDAEAPPTETVATAAEAIQKTIKRLLSGEPNGEGSENS